MALCRVLAASRPAFSLLSLPGCRASAAFLQTLTPSALIKKALQLEGQDDVSGTGFLACEGS